MYYIRFSTLAKRRLKKLSRSGAFPEKRLALVVQLLRRGGILPAQYQDHALQGAFADYRELHAAFDFLLVYKRNEGNKTVTIADLGSHQQIFGD